MEEIPEIYGADSDDLDESLQEDAQASSRSLSES